MSLHFSLSDLYELTKLGNLSLIPIVYGHDGKIDFKNMTLLPNTWINYPDNCRQIDFTNFKWPKFKDSFFIFVKLETIFEEKYTDVEMVVEGKNMACERTVQRNNFQQSGSQMRTKFQIVENFMINIKQNIFIEQDFSMGCRIYPNEHGESYNECDKKFTWRKIKEIIGDTLGNK